MDGNTDESIHALFNIYQNALNTSNLDLAMSIYAPEDDSRRSHPAFIAPHSPPSIGLKAIRSAYEQLFAKVDHMITLQIQDVTLTSDDASWAFVRTRCTGKCRVGATGEELQDDVQGTWVLQWYLGDEGLGAWKVASYHFSSTLPPEGSSCSSKSGYIVLQKHGC